MPNYGFICNKCTHQFDSLLSIDDRDIPLKKKCPKCKKTIITPLEPIVKKGCNYN